MRMSNCFVFSNEDPFYDLNYPGFPLMHKTLFLILTTRALVQCHVERTRDIALCSFFLPSLFPNSDLFLPTHCRRRGLLLCLITLK